MKKNSRKKEGTKEFVAVKRTLSAPMEEELLRFIDSHPVARLSRNLRNYLIESLTYQGGTDAMVLKDLLLDLRGLYELLDCIEREEQKTIRCDPD